MARPLPGLRASGARSSRRRERRGRGRAARRWQAAAGALTPGARCATCEAPRVARLSTGIGELDRVLGGGLVPGSLVLLGGSPGIGKSTITASALGNLAAGGRRVLYVSGEESAAQVRLRAERLGAGALAVPIVAETDLDAVVATIEAERPDVCVVDSVQVLHAAALTGAPGLGRPGARGGRAADARGQGARRRRDPGRPRDQGGRARRAARARAPRGLRAQLRGRARAHLPHAARAQEPLRLDQRGGRLRDARRGAGRGRGRLGAVRGRGHAGAGIGGAVRDGGIAAAAGRGAGAGGAHRAGAAAADGQRGRPQPARAGAGRARPPRRASRSARADVFVSLAGGVRVDEPGADLAVALAVASAARGVPLGDGAPPAGAPSASSASPASCATPPTRTAAWQRPRSSASTGVLHPADAAAGPASSAHRAPRSADSAAKPALPERIPRCKAK